MKVSAKKVELYEIEAWGKSVGTFRITGEWKGFLEMVDITNTVHTLICTTDEIQGFGEAFKSMFGNPFQAPEEPTTFYIHKASPSFLAFLKDLNPDKDDSDGIRSKRACDPKSSEQTGNNA